MIRSKVILTIRWLLRAAAAISTATLFFKFTGGKELIYIFSTLHVEPAASRHDRSGDCYSRNSGIAAPNSAQPQRVNRYYGHRWIGKGPHLSQAGQSSSGERPSDGRNQHRRLAE